MRTHRHRFVLLAVRLFIVALFSLCLINAPASLCRQAMAAGWVIETPDSAGVVGSFTSLAFDLSGNPAISYYDATNGDLKFARFNGATWDITTVDSEEYVGWFTSLAFNNPSGNPAISYYDYTNSELKFARYNGATWDITTVDSAGVVGEFTSLAFDPSGNPAISYWDGSNSDLKFARFNGATWDITTLDSAGNVGYYTSLAFDLSGNPAISYYDWTNRDLKYMDVVWHRPCIFCEPIWVWQRTTVDSAGDVGENSSLAFDPSGNPAISYFEHTNGNLRFARFDGDTWSINILDLAGYVGEYTSLAFDLSGNPAISYFDGTNSDLKFTRNIDDVWWDKTTVDSAGYVGEYTSLAFDPSGNPAISYFDGANNGDLKYAHYVPDLTTTTTTTTSSTTTTTLPPKICRTCPFPLFSMWQGTTQCRSIKVRNCRKGTLNWTVSGDCDWLTLSPSSGTSTGEIDTITACVNTTEMAKGGYKCTVTITGENAKNSPQTCVIRLRVR